MFKGNSHMNGPTGSYSGPTIIGKSDVGQNILSASHWDSMEPRTYE